MRATTPDKALLRAVWERVKADQERRAVPLTEVAPRLRKGSTAAGLHAIELDARLLHELGYLRLSGANGSRQVELTQMGALLADRLTLPE